MHSRRARPTVRVLTEDLSSDWSSPHPRRMLAQAAYESLHPLSELPHPIIAKAAETFSQAEGEDNPVGPIASSSHLQLWEIKTSQWRGGVWADSATGVHWLVVAGLAKGDHQDHDDFYERVKAGNSGFQRWLPTELDIRLLKRETAARLITEWELGIQSQVLEALREVHAGGSTRFSIEHPVPGNGLVTEVILAISSVREADYEADDIDVEFLPTARYVGDNLFWKLTIRVLVALSPPHEGWDIAANLYSNIGEPGQWSTRVTELGMYVGRHELVESELGRHCHFTHRSHLAGKAIEGQAARALCGVYFVPCRDPKQMPVCPDCQQRYSELPVL